MLAQCVCCRPALMPFESTGIRLPSDGWDKSKKVELAEKSTNKRINTALLRPIPIVCKCKLLQQESQIACNLNMEVYRPKKNPPRDSYNIRSLPTLDRGVVYYLQWSAMHFAMA